MAGGSKSESKQQSTSQQQSGSGQTWANPFAQQAVGDIMGVYNANKPNLDAQVARANTLADQFVTDWTGAGERSLAAGDAAGAGVPYFNDVLAGKYLTGNPYIDQIIQQTGRNVTGGVNSQFSLAGRYGSGAHTDVLGRALADMEAQTRFNNYNAERGYMQQAAGTEQASLEAAAERAAREKAAAAALALEQQKLAAGLPYTGTDNLANALGALFSGGSGSSQSTGTSYSKQSPDILGSLGNAAIGAAMMSDPSVKHSVVPLFREPDGLGWYEYSLLGSDEREFGVMADEVAELRPWALGPEIDGIMTVDYDLLEAA